MTIVLTNAQQSYALNIVNMAPEERGEVILEINRKINNLQSHGSKHYKNRAQVGRVMLRMIQSHLEQMED